MLRILSTARNHREYRDRLPQAQNVIEETLEKLRAGLLAFEDVVVTKNLSQGPTDYQKANLTAIVAGELTQRGVRLNPGEAIQYVVTEAGSGRARAYATITPDWGYDMNYYEEQLRIAARELLDIPFPHSEGRNSPVL